MKKSILITILALVFVACNNKKAESSPKSIITEANKEQDSKAKNLAAETKQVQYSKTNDWNIDQFFLNPKHAKYSGVRNKIINQREKWRNVPIPLVATYVGTEFGDYFYFYFKDINGIQHNFAYGKNELGKFNLYYKDSPSVSNKKYVGKIFRIFWEWKPSQFPCCQGGHESFKAYQPSIVKLELIETNSNNAYKSENVISKPAFINGTNVNMRKSYTTKSPIVSTFKNSGERVIVLDIYYPNNIETLINSEITVKTDGGNNIKLQKGKAVKILSNHDDEVRIEFLDHVTKNILVATIHENYLDKLSNSIWYKVKRKTEETGWVFGKFVYVE